MSIRNSILICITPLSLLAQNANAEERPNIVIINLDDAGYGDFSYNGAIGYKTPNIDKLASEGVKFTQFLVAQPVSGASRAGLLTGCYPNRVGMSGAPYPNSPTGINPDEMTIAELVKQQGYATAIFGKWHLGDATQFLPLQNGFDEYYGIPYSNDMWPFHPLLKIFGDLPTIKGNKIVGYNTDQTQFTTDFTNYAVNFIRKNRKNPFFLYLAHPMPHVPLAVSDKFKGQSEQGLYGDVMMEIDWSVEQILQTLQKYGLEENTLIVLTSDNGPWINYGNHGGSTAGLKEGKGATFEGGNRVPCVIYWKGVTVAGSTCNRLTSNIDLFPTIAEITESPLPAKKIDGVSLLPLIKGDDSANPRKDFVYYYGENNLEAVTNGAFKLIFPHTYRSYESHLPANDGAHGKTTNIKLETPLLFDLRRDIGERYNVIDKYPEIVKELTKIADAYRKDIGDDLTGATGLNKRKPGYSKDYEKH